ncbi:MAG: hypothetical protein ACKV2O_04570 [Acidimicrobiales bacterium]
MHDAERALGLADEAIARSDVEGAITHFSAAIRGFTAAHHPRQAAMVCVRLGETMANLLGNLTAACAWFARATRLVAELPPCIEQGWVAVAAMGCDVDDPTVLLARAELALERARRFGDLNLETKALADGGLAHVQAGRVTHGMAMLDEAMALACGPADDMGAAAKSVCSFFTACYFTADFARASTWADLLRRQGLIGNAAPGPVFLSSHCDSVQATLLMEMGRWSDAERVLERAIAKFETAMGGVPAWHPAIALADLRTRQGRFTEAEALLIGKDQAMQALLPLCRLHLERGDHELAAATARRGLRMVGQDQLRAAELLTLLLDAQLAGGDLASATATSDVLRQRTAAVTVPTLRARSSAARARLLAVTGDVSAAVSELESTIDEVDGVRLPWLRATMSLALTALYEQGGDTAAATRSATATAAAIAALDVSLPAADQALLERLTAPHRPRRSPAQVATLAYDGGWWVASCNGISVKLRDSKGMRYLAELMATPGRERHALDLVDRVEGVAAGRPDRRSLGHAGELLDGRARTAYRHRIEALRAEVQDALAEARFDTAETLQAELDALVAQLAAAFGLGGRHRVAGSVAERARLNVTRALRTAVGTIMDALPQAGAALDRGVRTGLYCAYELPNSDIHWIVQS